MLLYYFICRHQSLIQWKNVVIEVMMSNTIVIKVTLILVVNMLLVHFIMMKDWGVPTLDGLIQWVPNDKKTLLLLLSSIKIKKTLKPSYITCEGK